MASNNDQTPYGEQWIGGTLRNPIHRADGFFAEIVIYIRRGATPPRDATFTFTPKNQHRDISCWKEVQITEAQFIKMMEKK